MTETKTGKRLLASYPAVAEWLREQESTIVPPWISAAQRMADNMQLRRGPDTRQLESAQLMELFDGIVSAVRHGATTKLDLSIQKVVTDRLGQGYRLTDFVDIAADLKNNIWQAARSSLSPEQTLETLTALESIFVYGVTRLAWLASRAAEAQLEEELEQTRQLLARLDHTKSDFISIAAHELKTPLTLIRGYTALLSSDLAAQPELESVFDGLNNGIKRLQVIIEDMIDVSVIDSNVLALSWQPASLAEIIQLAVDDLKREASGRRLDIKVKPFPPQANRMYLDAPRMYQVFTNLIGNAIKYTPDGGRITLTARILPDYHRDLEFIKVVVADTGIGIHQNDLSSIFEKFYRVGSAELHSTSKTGFKGGGPGLGLAIAKGIIESHGGRIWAESPGYDEERCPGSSFCVMLPIHREPPERPSRRLLGLK